MFYTCLIFKIFFHAIWMPSYQMKWKKEEKKKWERKQKNTNNSNIVSVYSQCMWHVGRRWIACAQVTQFHIHISSVYIYIEDWAFFHPHFAYFWHFGIFISFLYFFSHFILSLFFFRAVIHSNICSHAITPMERKIKIWKISRSVKNRHMTFRVFRTQ